MPRRIAESLKSSVPRIGREAIVVALGQVLVAAGGLYGVRLLTHALAPADYGVLALAVSLATGVHLCIFAPLTQGFIRYFSISVENKDFGGYLRSVWWLVLLVSIAVLFLAGSCSVVMRGTYSDWSILVLITPLFAILLGWNSVYDHLQSAARRRVIVASHQSVAVWLRYIIAYLVVTKFISGVEGVLLGFVLAASLIFVSEVYFFSRLRRCYKDESLNAGAKRNWTREIICYSWPFMTWAVFSWAQLVSDRWALEVFASTAEVGKYVVLYQLGFAPISLATQALTQLVAPIFFQQTGDPSKHGAASASLEMNVRIVYLVVFFAFLLTGLAWGLHRPIFALLTPVAYHQVSSLLPWLVLAAGIYAAAHTATMSAMTTGETKKLISLKITTALLGVVLNILGARYLGAPGVILATLTFSVVYLLWAFIVLKRLLKHFTEPCYDQSAA